MLFLWYSKAYTSECCKNKGRKFRNFCKSSSHNYKTCCKSKDKASTVNDAEHSDAFKVKETDFYLPCDKIFLVECDATTHTINYDSYFVFIDDNFNPYGHFIELADGTRSNNVAKKRGTVVSSFVLKRVI